MNRNTTWRARLNLKRWWTKTSAARRGKPDGAHAQAASLFTDEDARKVMERLKGMGYIWHI